jgi:hypothetical protein
MLLEPVPQSPLQSQEISAIVAPSQLEEDKSKLIEEL